jgi:hypothetical protein
MENLQDVENASFGSAAGLTYISAKASTDTSREGWSSQRVRASIATMCLSSAVTSCICPSAERDCPGEAVCLTTEAGSLTHRQAYNMIAQRDSQVMTGLRETARRDSGVMRTIAVVTMAFLPPTFLSIRAPRCCTTLN